MNRACHELLQDFPVCITIPILWGDEDALGHVNNTVYLRWAETSRIAYMTRIGLWQRLASDHVGPIMASITCNYRRPLNYPDTVHVGARVGGIGNTSFRMEHKIVSAAHAEVAADLDSAIVVLDYRTGKKIRVPEEIRAAIRGLEDASH